MTRKPPHSEAAAADRALQAYLLGSVEFEDALVWQRRLAYQIAGTPEQAALLLCEHPPLITVGRHGSRAHILCDAADLRARRWPVRWVNRGGGCVLHLPGQLAIYPVLSLAQFGLGLEHYLDLLRSVLVAALADFTVAGEMRHGASCVSVGDRPVAAGGVAVCNWVTYHGLYLNVSPDLEPFRKVLCGGAAMTSLERERRGPVRPALVRERVLEHFATQFGFARTSLFSGHPALSRRAPSDAIATSR